ncbi:MAG: hypothetical protein NTU98_05345 [Bacteroidetes bacterium]|nr:hypothetical protein [Bacteroidota bacterium]
MKKLTFLLLLCLVLLFAGCSKKSSSDDTTSGSNCTWTTVFSDDFNRINGPIGNNYQDTILSVYGQSGSGFADIFNNSLRVSTNQCYWAIWYLTNVDGSKIRSTIKCTVPSAPGPYNFGLGGRMTSPGQMSQTGYFGGINADTLQIFRINGTSSQRFAAHYYKIQSGHTYKLSLVIDEASIIATVIDLNTDETASITATDTGSNVPGKIFSINGNTFGGQADLLFDDFLIERCQ